MYRFRVARFRYSLFNELPKCHDDVIKWKLFPRYWPFVREIHRSRVNSPHKGQWRGALMFSLIYAWINNWINSREADDLRGQCTHYDVIVMLQDFAVTLIDAIWCMQWQRSINGQKNSEEGLSKVSIWMLLAGGLALSGATCPIHYKP